VTVDVVLTEGERRIMENLTRKARAAESMFSNLVNEMGQATGINRINPYTKKERLPKWL
jgi:hypothetical protein